MVNRERKVEAESCLKGKIAGALKEDSKGELLVMSLEKKLLKDRLEGRIFAELQESLCSGF